MPVVVQYDEPGSLAGAKAETKVVDYPAVKAQLEGELAASKNHVARAGVPLEEFSGGEIGFVVRILHDARRHHSQLYGDEGSEKPGQCPTRQRAGIPTGTQPD